jgi:hypothetical protein
MTANLMTVYDGNCALGEIGDHLRVRTYLSVGRCRKRLGTHADRRSAMRAVPQAAKADQASP